MAKTAALARPSVIVVNTPRRGGRIRRYASRGGALVRRGARAFHRRAKAHYSPASIAIGAMAVGYGVQKGYLDKLPQIAGSKMTTLGIGGYAAVRWGKQGWLRTAGIAALAAAAFDFGRVQAGGTSGIDDDAGWGPSY